MRNYIKIKNKVKIPTIHGYIDRRILINFIADPKSVEKRIVGRLPFILLLLFLSCTGQDENKKQSDYHNKYNLFYDKTQSAIEKKDSTNFHTYYDSTKIYLDTLLTKQPNSVNLLRKKLGLLILNNDLKEMIGTYNLLIKNDSLNSAQKQDLKFGQFYCMALTDSILYKKQMVQYYNELQRNELKINILLKNPDPYKDQPQIYKRMCISYYFEGKEKTLQDFESISQKIPYKFKYDMIQENLKDRIDFLKDGMDFPIKHDWK